MNFVADESVDAPIYKTLLNAGHTVFAIVENNPGIDDEQVLQIAYQKEAILPQDQKENCKLKEKAPEIRHPSFLTKQHKRFQAVSSGCFVSEL
ncbi:DUF5615 family PIN-like protein [Pseudoflavitalea rhizosphaerae]|uniref:DUF5615 family PIN-like protein n=1 Tax=Pseudoflavitalea rhizosphaerae TaxID=1884793 RepID=UPI000F8C592F|nr:DUF5615 family PIN-like protein [Pseudoflavitalea rhizosphaerae]